MRQGAIFFGMLCSLSTLSLGLTEGLLLAAPFAILAATNLAVGALARESIARVFVFVEVGVILLVGSYALFTVARSSS
jgi:hypothetical protein